MEINAAFAHSYAPPQSADHLRKLILKLRWIGEDSEAEKLCIELARLAPQEIALDLPVHTD